MCEGTDAIRGAVHDVVQTSATDKQVNMVTTDSSNFNSIHLVIVATFKMNCNQISEIIPYEIDTGSDDNIMP